MATDCDNILMIVEFGKPIAQSANQGIDCLFRDTKPLCVRPDSIDNLISATDRSIRLAQQVQEPELGQREWGGQLLSEDPHLSAVAIDGQPSGHSGCIQAERDGCLGANKEKFDAEGNLDFIAILKGAVPDEGRTIEPCAVLASQIFDGESVAVANRSLRDSARLVVRSV